MTERVGQRDRPTIRANADQQLVVPAAELDIVPVSERQLERQGGPIPPARDAQWNRGAYIATALAHCGECHTPRNLLGALDAARPYAGNPAGVDGESVPNISSHREDGVGRWDVDDLAEYFESGMTPEADFAGGAMADVIDNGLTHLSDADREALALYLKSMPAFAD